MQKVSCRISEITQKYGDLKQFCQTYNPQRQLDFCVHKERCFFGSAPTLAELNAAYSSAAARFWLHYQILDLCRFTNVKTMNDNQVMELAQLIAINYHYLKTTELMYFFFRVKSGDYGEFYGSIDPMRIMAALKQFIRYRGELIQKKEQEDYNAKVEQWKKNAITYEEYINRNKNGQDRII